MHENLLGGGILGANGVPDSMEITDLATFDGLLNYQTTSLSDAKYVLKTVFNVHTHTQDEIEDLILPSNGSVGVGLNHYCPGTTGQTNSSIGGSNLGSLTSGEINVALGNSVLQNCTTGSYNIGMSHLAIAGCTTGSNNIGIGYESLLNTQTGNKNVGIGYQAGKTPINKSNNI